MSKGNQSERGQASVELVAVIPALILVLALAVQAALAGWTLWSAQNAARAGARAAAVSGDAEGAARSALPGRLQRSAEVTSDGAVRVTVGVPRAASGLPRLDVEAEARLPGADGAPG